jgi:hypothetical protein
MAWRTHSATITLCATVLGGLGGLVIWVLALTGAIEQAGFFLPKKADPLTFVTGVTGLVALAGGATLIWLRVRMGPSIDVDVWPKRTVLLGFVIAVVVYVSAPSLHS